MTQIQELGYEVVESVLSHGECDGLLASLLSLTSARSRAGARHLLAVPTVNRLANDSRLVAAATRMLGGIGIPFRVTLFDKSQAANWSVVWHQDTALPVRARVDAPGWGPWSRKAGVLYAHAPTPALMQVVALRLHLDESARHNGPLRVTPATHHLGVLTGEEVAKISRERTAVDCVTGRGGIVAMRPLIIHSSTRGSSGASRRVLHIEYTCALEIQPGIELAAA